MLKTRKIDLTELLLETIEWNKVANLGEYDFSEARKDLQLKCFVEEIKEFIKAYEESDSVEMLDALCDILFVGIYGYFLESNGDVDLSDLIYSYDMIDPSDNPIFAKEEGLLTELSGQFSLCLGRGIEPVDLYKQFCEVILCSALVLDVDFRSAYENVVNSNFTKFPLVSDVCVSDELSWFNTESKYDAVCFKEFEGRLIFRCDDGDGKIVKPRAFEEPKLEQFINE